MSQLTAGGGGGKKPWALIPMSMQSKGWIHLWLLEGQKLEGQKLGSLL